MDGFGRNGKGSGTAVDVRAVQIAGKRILRHDVTDIL